MIMETTSTAKSAEPLAVEFPHEDEPLTRENILNALPAAPDIQDWSGSRIVRVRSDVVVEYGPIVHISEANNIRHVRQNSSVNAPDVLDAWSEPKREGMSEPRSFRGHEEERTYIVMRYIKGTVLTNMWPKINQAQCSDVVNKVAAMLNQLHSLSLKQPGPIGQGVRCNGCYFTAYGAGPFETAKDLQDLLNNRLLVCKHFKRVFQDQAPFDTPDLAMCHMDLHPHNIIIDEEQRPWLVDWAFSGGFSVYLEKANLLVTYGLDDHGEFQRKLNQALQDGRHQKELGTLRHMGYAFTTGAIYRRPDLEELMK